VSQGYHEIGDDDFRKILTQELYPTETHEDIYIYKGLMRLWASLKPLIRHAGTSCT